METYYALGRLIVLVEVIGQCALLCVLVWAISKHRHHCFILLALGAAVALIYGLLGGLPFFTAFDLHARILLARALLILLPIGGALWIWGAVLLVRSYRSVGATNADDLPE